MALFINIKRISIGLLLLITSSMCFANSSHNIYMMTLSILSYTKWNVPSPSLCIVGNNNNTQITNAFLQGVKTQNISLQVKGITEEQLALRSCDAIFFTQSTPESEQKLINQSYNKSILSFSKDNPECEIGSIFCLYTSKKGNTLFKVNLDSLAKSKIHVDPRVLLLAKNSE
ncbi:YfiR family protein [Acinetobacter shaoyimingii]|uniref:YfiR family protein n=2 Tax=Acinetobacter shaoyimingii TaxID=2715164 RepID=A0A6G8RTE7_9GAMM|nr:YfiR family protein [Acinetobacter shaoyimingii]QIO05147.1 YfiR family protein [Acinetobacter shaoyimingii]